MQVTQIELKVGVRLNVGDYQGVNAEVTMRADLDPREGEGGAFDALRRSAVQQLAATCLDAHPNQLRNAMSNESEIAPRDKGHPALTDNTKTPAEAPKTRTRRTKEQIAADEAAAKAEAERKRLAEAQLGETANLGEDDNSDGPGLGDDAASMLGDDGIPDEGPAITREMLKAALGKVAKTKGSPALAKILQDFKVSAFPELKEEQYAAAYRAAEKALA